MLSVCVRQGWESILCSRVCWQKARYSRTRPRLVSVRILCSFASTHFCSVFFSFFLILSKSGNRDCLFLFYMPYLFIYIIFLHLRMPCLILDWFCDRGEIVRTGPSLRPIWSSLFDNPAPDSQRRLQALFSLPRNKLVANENKWKRQLNLAGERIGKKDFFFYTCYSSCVLSSSVMWVCVSLMDILNIRSARDAAVCP